jgi:RNA polymerase sigma-70 factor (ECF subfamily)
MSSSAARYFPRPFGPGSTLGSANPQNLKAFTEAQRTESVGQRGSTEAAAITTTDIASSLGEPSDETLLARVCDGNQEALAYLFRRHSRVVRAICYRVLRDASEADDLVQDVFLLVHRKCRTFDCLKAPARFWILQMAYRRAISRRRYLTSRHFYTRVDIDNAAIHPIDPRMGVRQIEDSIDGRLGNGSLQKVFEALTENQRQTLRMHFMEGYTLDEIATKLGQSRGNIKHHYFRGLDRLRKVIFDGKLPGDRAI